MEMRRLHSISCSDFDSQILFFADDEVMTQSLLGPD